MFRSKLRTMGWSFILLCVIAGAVLVSCSAFTPETVNMLPPARPGAEYVGSDLCKECHEKEYAYSAMSDHASVTIALSEDEQEEGKQVEGCETCHGPGSLHVAKRGGKNTIDKGNAETCFRCHLGVKGRFMLQHHHPVPEGRMLCSDCHNLHGKDVRATGRAMLLGKDERCFKCHKDQRGPFVFEHDAMREGCGVCHSPHGSVSDKLLVAGPTVTCVRCHIEDKHGEVHHHYDCGDCHTKVHGSNNAASSLRY